MIVVSDTTPIISLMKAGRLELLHKLFGTVYIPEAVYQELTENKAFSEEARMVHEFDFFRVEKVNNEKSVTILRNFTNTAFSAPISVGWETDGLRRIQAWQFLMQRQYFSITYRKCGISLLPWRSINGAAI